MDKEIQSTKEPSTEDIDSVELEWATQYALRNAQNENPVHNQIQSAMDRFFTMMRSSNDKDIDINKFYEEEQERFEADYLEAQDQEFEDDQALEYKDQIGAVDNKKQSQQAKNEIDEFEKSLAKWNQDDDSDEKEEFDTSKEIDKYSEKVQQDSQEQPTNKDNFAPSQEEEEIKYNYNSPQKQVIKVQPTSHESPPTVNQAQEDLEQLLMNKVEAEKRQLVDDMLNQQEKEENHEGDQQKEEEPKEGWNKDQTQPEFGNSGSKANNTLDDTNKYLINSPSAIAEDLMSEEEKLEKQFLREYLSIVEERDPISDRKVNFEQRLIRLLNLTQTTLTEVQAQNQLSEQRSNINQEKQDVNKFENQNSNKSEQNVIPNEQQIENQVNNQQHLAITADFYEQMSQITQEAVKKTMDSYISQGKLSVNNNNQQQQQQQTNLRSKSALKNSHNSNTNKAPATTSQASKASENFDPGVKNSYHSTVLYDKRTPTADKYSSVNNTSQKSNKNNNNNNIHSDKKKTYTGTGSGGSSNISNLDSSFPQYSSNTHITRSASKVDTNLGGRNSSNTNNNTSFSRNGINRNTTQQKTPERSSQLSSSKTKPTMNVQPFTTGNKESQKSSVQNYSWKTKDYDAEFLEVLGTVPEIVTLNNRIIHKKVRIKNIGNKIWPLTTFIIPIDEKKGKTFRLNSVVKPGNELQCTLILNNPGSSGEHMISYRIGYIDENLKAQWFGEAFYIELNIEDGDY